MAKTSELVRPSTEPGLLSPLAPLREMKSVRNLIDSAFEDFFSGKSFERSLELLGGGQWLPAVDVEETEKEYVCSLALPGVEKDEFHVETQNGTLVVSGERKEKKEEKGKNYLRHEQYYGSFRRSFTLPADASSEGIKAIYRNGVLKLTIPRVETAKPKSIKVSVE
jgi:HSP20 family protein